MLLLLMVYIQVNFAYLIMPNHTTQIESPGVKSCLSSLILTAAAAEPKLLELLEQLKANKEAI